MHPALAQSWKYRSGRHYVQCRGAPCVWLTESCRARHLGANKNVSLSFMCHTYFMLWDLVFQLATLDPGLQIPWRQLQPFEKRKKKINVKVFFNSRNLRKKLSVPWLTNVLCACRLSQTCEPSQDYSDKPKSPVHKQSVHFMPIRNVQLSQNFE